MFRKSIIFVVFILLIIINMIAATNQKIPIEVYWDGKDKGGLQLTYQVKEKIWASLDKDITYPEEGIYPRFYLEIKTISYTEQYPDAATIFVAILGIKTEKNPLTFYYISSRFGYCGLNKTEDMSQDLFLWLNQWIEFAIRLDKFDSRFGFQFQV